MSAAPKFNARQFLEKMRSHPPKAPDPPKVHATFDHTLGALAALGGQDVQIPESNGAETFCGPLLGEDLLPATRCLTCGHGGFWSPRPIAEGVWICTECDPPDDREVWAACGAGP